MKSFGGVLLVLVVVAVGRGAAQETAVVAADSGGCDYCLSMEKAVIRLALPARSALGEPIRCTIEIEAKKSLALHSSDLDRQVVVIRDRNGDLAPLTNRGTLWYGGGCVMHRGKVMPIEDYAKMRNGQSTGDVPEKAPARSGASPTAYKNVLIFLEPGKRLRYQIPLSSLYDLTLEGAYTATADFSFVAGGETAAGTFQIREIPLTVQPDEAAYQLLDVPAAP